MGKGKFYAVRKGLSTGIFTNWAACEAAVKGFKGAEYKSFGTQEEARAYLAGGGNGAAAPAAAAAAAGQQQRGRPTSTSTGGGRKFYAIVCGRRTGVLQGTWDDVKGHVSGFPGASYKSFSTQQEAQQHYASMTGNNPPGVTTAAAAAAAAAAAGASSLAGSKRPHSAIDTSNPPPPAFTAAGTSTAAAGPAGVPGQQQQQQQQPGELQVTVYFDGGSRSNPGRAGYGYVVYNRATGTQMWLACRPLPYGSTNNEAEYSGMIAGLRYCEVIGARHVVVRGDSELIVKQMKGINRVASERLLPYFREAKLLSERFDSFEIQHVYREDNMVADKLSNIAMDTDAMVARMPRGLLGSSRREMAVAFLTACDVKGKDVRDKNGRNILQELVSAPSFMDAAASYLVNVWDSMPLEEVLAALTKQGWNTHTGGPPQQQGPDGTSGGSSSGRAAAVGGGGQQTVAVAAVSLGPGWAAEIARQQQQQQQQQQQRGQQQRPLSYGQQFLVQPQHQQQQQGQQQQQRQQQQWQGGLGGGGSSGVGAVGFFDRGGGRGRGRLHASSSSSSLAFLPPAAGGISSGSRRAGRPCLPVLSSSSSSSHAVTGLPLLASGQAGQHQRGILSSSTSSRVLPWHSARAPPVRCSCGAAAAGSGREMCALHAALCRGAAAGAGLPPRVRVAAAAAGVLAVAAGAAGAISGGARQRPSRLLWRGGGLL